MSRRSPVNILSDDETEQLNDDISTPLVIHSKKQFDSNSTTTIFVIDDDPTPQKLTGSSAAQTSLVVPDTPMSDLVTSGPSIVKCTRDVLNPKPSGVFGLVLLESDNESDSVPGNEIRNQSSEPFVTSEVKTFSELSSRFTESAYCFGNSKTAHMQGNSSLDVLFPEYDAPQLDEVDMMQPLSDVLKTHNPSKHKENKKKEMDDAKRKKQRKTYERLCSMEEKKQQKEQEKLQKAALKAEALEMKKVQKQKKKWGQGKFPLTSMVAEVDTKVVELGSVGGRLLTRFAEKGIKYKVKPNPIERSIVWAMTIPEPPFIETEIPYVVLVYEADEFCSLFKNESLVDHISCVRSHYPTHTICYLTNKLMSHINSREQAQYKDPKAYSGWKRPPVEQVLSNLTTYFSKVHSRHCVDEAELAEHVVGLTCSLVSCKFRKKLTRLSVYANGSLIPKDCVDKTLIKNNFWLKALIAIPKVQPRFAIAIWRKYPTMKSLLNIYMDPTKSLHEKEFLLKDLTTEALVGEERRLGEICSKRVYRILMAQCGDITTDDAENGADSFCS